MAYMNQQMKAERAPAIKAVLKKYGMKGTIAVRNHSTLVVNIQSGKLDIIGESTYRIGTTSIQVNPYCLGDMYQGESYHFLKELKEAMDVGNWDHSDYQSDYFNCGFYLDINVGAWDKPYVKVA